MWVYVYLLEALLSVLWGYRPQSGGLSFLVIFSMRLSWLCPQLFLASMNPRPYMCVPDSQETRSMELPKLERCVRSPGCKEHGGIFKQISCFPPSLCLQFVRFSRVLELIFRCLPCLSLDVPCSHYLPATKAVTTSSSAIDFPEVMYYPFSPHTFFPSLVSSLMSAYVGFGGRQTKGERQNK